MHFLKYYHSQDFSNFSKENKKHCFDKIMQYLLNFDFKNF